MTPKFRRGQFVFINVHNEPMMSRGTVTGVYNVDDPNSDAVVYTVLRADGKESRYEEIDLGDAEAAFVGSGPGKYETLAAFAAKLLPGEPWFAVRARDNLSLRTVDKYKWLLHELGDFDGMHSINALKIAILNWRQAHSTETKNPD